jgi:hypothetical protein
VTRPAGAAGVTAAFAHGATSSALARAVSARNRARQWQSSRRSVVYPHCAGSAVCQRSRTLTREVVALRVTYTDVSLTTTAKLFYAQERVCPSSTSRYITGNKRRSWRRPKHRRRRSPAVASNLRRRTYRNSMLLSDRITRAAGARPPRRVNKTLEVYRIFRTTYDGALTDMLEDSSKVPCFQCLKICSFAPLQLLELVAPGRVRSFVPAGVRPPTAALRQ